MLGHQDLMHPTLHAAPFTTAGWLFEMKLDGFRALACRRGGNVELLSRTGRSMAHEFPEVMGALSRISGDWAADAELVVPMSVGTLHLKRRDVGRSCAGKARSTSPRWRCQRRYACSMCWSQMDAMCE